MPVDENLPHATGTLTSLSVAYQNRINRGELEADQQQHDIVLRLDALLSDLQRRRLAHKKSALGWLFQKNHPEQESVSKGLYIWGGVGRGKSMVMDMFFEAAPNTRKKRVHFHDFMQDIHARIHHERTDLKGRNNHDPLPPVARAIADEVRLLCFDEFSVTDVADAMILSRLFSMLFKSGVVMVATSNVHPDNLYPHGLNRSYFLKFIDLLKQRVDIVQLDTATDYRLEKAGCDEAYYMPLNQITKDALDARWRDLTAGVESTNTQILVQGRILPVPVSSGTMARFSFADLCQRPLGPGDYLAIAARFNFLFIENIPVMKFEQRNEAKRFINLIDTLYDNSVKLIASAEAKPEALYTAVSGTEKFEFRRTVSRLVEMQSLDYLKADRWQQKAA